MDSTRLESFATVPPSARRCRCSTSPDVGLLLREAPAHGMTVLGAPGVLPADLVPEA
jgi:hypothetical protein